LKKSVDRDKNRRFSAREARALLWLLPVLAVVSWLVWEISRPKPAAGSADSERITNETDPPPREKLSSSVIPNPSSVIPNRREGSSRFPTSEAFNPSPPRALAQPFPFDPNTVDYHDLLRLGFERGEALGILKFRARGKIFEIPEDFAACYQVSEENYRRLEPYIRIGDQYRLQPFERQHKLSSFRNRRYEREHESLLLMPSREEEDFAKRSNEEYPRHLGEGEVVGFSNSGQVIARNEAIRSQSGDSLSIFNFPLSTKIDLNTADSAALIAVVGIGARTAAAIIDYRGRLGGFVSVTQLSEVRGVTEQNYERILPQIFVDSAVIRKIDINFASAKQLSSHPYIGGGVDGRGGARLRKLLKIRQLKGGWRTPEEIESDDIFTTEEFMKLRHYLVFN
jgi:competence ComEA-like helix-hairpin-helix protein